MKRDCRSVGKVQQMQFNSISRILKELNIMIRHKNGKGQFSGFERYDLPVAAHDPRTLKKGGQCYDDNYLYHE
jgi:hypothetical protein